MGYGATRVLCILHQICHIFGSNTQTTFFSKGMDLLYHCRTNNSWTKGGDFYNITIDFFLKYDIIPT